MVGLEFGMQTKERGWLKGPLVHEKLLGFHVHTFGKRRHHLLLASLRI